MFIDWNAPNTILFIYKPGRRDFDIYAWYLNIFY